MLELFVQTYHRLLSAFGTSINNTYSTHFVKSFGLNAKAKFLPSARVSGCRYSRRDSLKASCFDGGIRNVSVGCDTTAYRGISQYSYNYLVAVLGKHCARCYHHVLLTNKVINNVNGNNLDRWANVHFSRCSVV